MVSRDDDFLLFSVQRYVAHTRATPAQREEREVEARRSGDEGDDKREIPGGYSTSPGK